MGLLLGGNILTSRRGPVTIFYKWRKQHYLVASTGDFRFLLPKNEALTFRSKRKENSKKASL